MSASSLASRSIPIGSASGVRRHELDWLRTAAVFGLIPFHTAIIFTTGSYDYVKNTQSSAVLDALTAFVSLWGIPVLFLVSGGASRYALSARGVARYLNERVMRLLIPFTFGMLLIVPLQIYIGLLSAPTPPPSLPARLVATQSASTTSAGVAAVAAAAAAGATGPSGVADVLPSAYQPSCSR